ncbi:hypothetical protein [uncultured Thiohalocapsa sp.]|uniref:hypothetical protein n=1 Tax=uncultured Thiohalocapsa sp. TaxID=768990 RepID=UPI0025D71E2A|nr:hypothetical protein [uncultured Thiohalocapsa sp.]
MGHASTNASHDPIGERLHRLRASLAQLDLEATGVRLVAAAVVIGFASLLLLEPAAHRNTDTTTERVARIAPVGAVRVAASAPAQRPAPAAAAGAAQNDS